jgi:hypothetical protein
VVGGPDKEGDGGGHPPTDNTPPPHTHTHIRTDTHYRARTPAFPATAGHTRPSLRRALALPARARGENTGGSPTLEWA